MITFTLTVAADNTGNMGGDNANTNARATCYNGSRVHRVRAATPMHATRIWEHGKDADGLLRTPTAERTQVSGDTESPTSRVWYLRWSTAMSNESTSCNSR
jgi:hypothetical protein